MSTNIATVTQTLKKLISTELAFQGEDPGDFVVSAAPPDAAPGDKYTISVYLFHVKESAEFKNLVPMNGTGPAPVRHTPMGLVLQYIVTVTGPDLEDPDLDDSNLTQQRLLGLVARAVHDYPIVTDSTQIHVPTDPDPTFILDADLQGADARLEFNLRPAPIEETISFWSAEEKNVPRLSLFVEGRIAILDPKPPEVAPGVTLSIGQFVFPSAEPQLLASRSTQWFLPPGALTARSVQAGPARVAVFDEPGSPNHGELSGQSPDLLNNNQLRLQVAGIGPGKRYLALRHELGDIRLFLDQPPSAQPPLNQPWAFSVTSEEISLSLWQQVVDAEGVTRDIFPGVYGVRLVVQDDRVGDVPRPRASNEITFTVVPQILTVLANDDPPENLYTIRLATAALRPESEVTLSVGGHPLRRTDAPPTEGEFYIQFSDVIDPPPPVSVIEFRMPFEDPAAEIPVPIAPTAENPLAVRLMVDGATATPAWLEAPAP